MSLSDMSAIFDNKLIGDNYSVWIRNLNMFLSKEGCRFVYEDPCPAKPTKYSSRQAWDDYNKWKDADERVCAVILSSIDKKYLPEVRDSVTAFGMISCLRLCFPVETRSRLFEIMGELTSTRMTEGASAKNHMLKMMSLISEYDILGGFIGSRSMLDIVLHSLTPAFAPLIHDIIISKKMVNLSSLGKEVLEFEAVLSKKEHHVDIQTHDLAAPSKPLKRERENVRTVMTRSKTLKIMIGEIQSRHICRRCNHPGHWKSDCPLKVKGVPGNKTVK